MLEGCCNCLAVYDWKGDIDPLRWYHVAVEFFGALGVEPDTAVCELSDRRGRPIQAKSVEKKIGKLMNSGSSASLNVELFLTRPNYKQLVFGWTVTADLLFSGGKTAFFCFDDSLRSFDPDLIKDLMSKMSALCEVRYGIAYQRPFELGPDAYALGMVVGLYYSDEDMAAGDLIGDWFRERMGRNRHMKGLLRDVYPLNFISRRQLESLVDGQPLAEWIAAAPDRGELAPFAEGIWCWSIPQEVLEAVRAALRPRGLLIAGHPETGLHD